VPLKLSMYALWVGLPGSMRIYDINQSKFYAAPPVAHFALQFNKVSSELGECHHVCGAIRVNTSKKQHKQHKMNKSVGVKNLKGFAK
jgi:hypothetical protein